MVERLAGARAREGWVRDELLMPLEEMNKARHRRDVAKPSRLGGMAPGSHFHRDCSTSRRAPSGAKRPAVARGHRDVISPRPLRAIQAVADKSWETTTRVARRITGRETLRRFQTARDRLRK